ncbi:MAG: serine hydrolase [Clostridia bacterium]|nr:serine hydrolase [Clostridia bacterium]
MVIDKIKLENNITNRVNKDIESNNILGANVYVFQNGKVLIDRSYGYKTVEGKIKLGKNHIFRLASMTKPIVAAAVLKLIEQGRIDLFDRADNFLEGFNGFYIGKLQDGKVVPVKKAENPIRILDLLTHTSGLVCGDFMEAYGKQMTEKDKKNLDSAIEFYKTTCLSFESYCGNSYSPVAGFDVLAKIIEIVSDLDIEDFLKKEIFMPLEMSDTTFTPNKEQWERLVDMHDKVDGKNVSIDMKGHIFADFPTSYKCGGAGLVSTIKDYAVFAEMLLNGGEYSGVRVLKESTVRSMRLPHILEMYSNPYESWGLGVRVIKDGYPFLAKNSFGWSGAYGTHFWVDPDNKIVAIYMKNSFYDGGSGAITAAHFEEDVKNSMD